MRAWTSTVRRATALALGAASVSVLGACGGYQMQGRVVTGARPEVIVVAKDDPRLGGPGVAGTLVDLTLDPESLGRKPLANGYSGPDGEFAIHVKEIGAGMLEYEVGVVARAPGHNPVYGQIILPGSNKRVLIVMVRGQDRPLQTPGTLDHAEQFLKEEDARQPLGR